MIVSASAGCGLRGRRGGAIVPKARRRKLREFGAARILPARSARSAMGDKDRIVLDPDVLLGKPVVKGTRLSVEFIVGLFAEGWTEPEILENYPNLAREDVRACLAYARDALASEKVFPSAA